MTCAVIRMHNHPCAQHHPPPSLDPCFSSSQEVCLPRHAQPVYVQTHAYSGAVRGMACACCMACTPLHGLHPTAWPACAAWLAPAEWLAPCTPLRGLYPLHGWRPLHNLRPPLHGWRLLHACTTQPMRQQAHVAHVCAPRRLRAAQPSPSMQQRPPALNHYPTPLSYPGPCMYNHTNFDIPAMPNKTTACPLQLSCNWLRSCTCIRG